jgi:hypothetical protein
MDFDKEIEWKESCIEALENCKAKIDREIEKLTQEKGEIAGKLLAEKLEKEIKGE